MTAPVKPTPAPAPAVGWRGVAVDEAVRVGRLVIAGLVGLYLAAEFVAVSFPAGIVCVQALLTGMWLMDRAQSGWRRAAEARAGAPCR